MPVKPKIFADQLKTFLDSLEDLSYERPCSNNIYIASCIKYKGPSLISTVLVRFHSCVGNLIISKVAVGKILLPLERYKTH